MNFGTPVPLLIGIILILGALALFFLDKFRPGYERDADKVYAVLLLISGLFLLAHLDMELLASFQQLLMAGMLTTLLIESVRTREPNDNTLRDPMMDRRPPRPRYEERPPVRRGYRAELDNRPEYDRPEFRGAQQPRMNPAQAPYRQDAYAQDTYARTQTRPPYEEFREPAGRLQPSRQSGPPPSGSQNGPQQRRAPSGGPPENRYSDNSRYGERPPAPRAVQAPGQANPQNRAPQRPPENRPVGPANSFRGPGESAVPPQNFTPNSSESQRPGQRGPGNRTGDRTGNRTEERRPEERPPERSPHSSQRNEGANNSRGNSRENSQENSVENSGSPARALNIRPMSEAPDFDDEYQANN